MQVERRRENGVPGRTKAHTKTCGGRQHDAVERPEQWPEPAACRVGRAPGSLRGKDGLGDTRPGVEILHPVKDLDFLLRAEGEKKRKK